VLTPIRRGHGEATVESQVAACYQRLRALPRRARRALQRHFALPLAELALILALWQGPAWTATINVDGITCTLGQAITAANTDTMVGDCDPGSGADTLVLPAGGTLTLTAADNDTPTYGPTGLPLITSTITIVGQGGTIERAGGSPSFRLLAVEGLAGNLTVQDLTLRGGVTSGSGGGVFNVGNLTMTNSTLSGNSAGFFGGGVYNAGSLTLANSTLTGNAATSNGGGIINVGSLTLANTLISGNLAPTAAEVNNILSGVVSADAFNLFGHDGDAGVFGFTPGTNDDVGAGPLSSILDSTLAFNGGPTETHALVPDSPALDVIAAGGCPPVDQRGFARPPAAACDIGAVEAEAGLPPVVSSPLDFVPLPETFSTTPDTTGCPGGVAGKFFFQAQLTNQDGGVFLQGLKQSVLSLSNGNLLQTADGGAGGVGGQQTLPQVGAFSDGTLEPAGAVVVPMAICLQTIDPFQFTVDVLGVQLEP
jgi:hypothetical protein